MAISKLIFNGVTQMDLTSDTVTASVLNSGYTAHDAAGEAITGTGGGGGGGSGNWMGMNPTKIQTYGPYTVLMKDSAMASWTWSTTSTSISAAQSLTAITGDTSHDYVQLVRFHAHYEYNNWSPVKAVKDYAFTGSYMAARYPNTYNEAISGIMGRLYTHNFTYNSQWYYHNSTGTLAYSYASNTAGIYFQAMPSISITDASTASPTITCKLPELLIKGDTNYFQEEAFQNLNMDTSYYEYISEVYEVDAGTSPYGFIRNCNVSLLNNGI